MQIRQRNILIHWEFFLKTGVLAIDYNTPSELIIATQQKISKNILIGVQQKTYKLVQQKTIQKRLITDLSNDELLQIIPLICNKFSKYKANIVKNILSLQYYLQISNVSSMMIRSYWWESVFEQLMQKNWLTKSITTFIQYLSIPQIHCVTLLTTTVEQTLPSCIEKSIIIQVLNKIHLKKITQYKNKANKIFTQQSVFQKFYLLITIGITPFKEKSGEVITEISKKIPKICKENPNIIKKIITNYGCSKKTAKRLVYTFDKNILIHFIHIFAHKFSSWVIDYMIWVNSIVINNINPIMWRKLNEEAILTYLFTYPILDQSKFIQFCLKFISKQSSQSIQKIFTLLLAKNIPNIAIYKLVNSTTFQQSIFLFQEHMPLKKIYKKKQPEKCISIYLQNGGLIFLYPFLQYLFDQLNFLDEDKFSDEVIYNNAIHSLQYLITGQLQTPEQDLTLNKLLCGLAYDIPISEKYILQKKNSLLIEDQELNEEELITAEEIVLLQEQCKKVLQDSMEKWTTLKNLQKEEPYKKEFTIDNFKNYILQRDGVLKRIITEETQYWHLTLSIKEYDSPEIMPPWSIDHIQLSWMEEPLIIYWLPNL